MPHEFPHRGKAAQPLKEIEMDYDMQKYATDRVAGYGPAQQTAEARQREVPHEMERLERTLKGVVQGIDTLEVRLSESVLRSSPPSTLGGVEKAPSAVPQTALSSRLQDFTGIAAHLNERIQGLLQRLEV